MHTMLQCHVKKKLLRFHLYQSQRRFCSNIHGMSKKTRENDFEKLVDLDKPYKRVMSLKEILLEEPENVISFAELGKKRAYVGLKGKNRFVNLVSKYTAVFDLFKDETGRLWCGFSQHAQMLADQEMELKQNYEYVAVQKLRKLLMMSTDGKIRVPKVSQLRRDLGFPEDFHSRIIYSYPQYFRVVDENYRNEDGPVLELTSWDNTLAVTSMESRAKAKGEFNSAGEPLFKMSISRAIRLSKKEKEGIIKFQELPFNSPYADSRELVKNTPEFEKRQVAILHEILSMTIEKKTVVDYLTHFRKEYRLPHSVLALLLRHNSIFYVSRKGDRFTVFLKEAYASGKLVDRNEWNLLKERYFALMDGREVKNDEDAKAVDARKTCSEGDEEESKHVEEEDEEFKDLLSLCKKLKGKGDNPITEIRRTVDNDDVV